MYLTIALLGNINYVMVSIRNNLFLTDIYKLHV